MRKSPWLVLGKGGVTVPPADPIGILHRLRRQQVEEDDG